jgi:hypothetical protein
MFAQCDLHHSLAVCGGFRPRRLSSVMKTAFGPSGERAHGADAATVPTA